MNFPPLEELIQKFSRFPGIGQKSAGRLVFYLLSQPEEDVRELAHSILTFREEIGSCPDCGGLSYHNTCPICTDGTRDKSVWCIVEQQKDVLSIERTGQFKGQYHVLGGVLAPLDGVGPDQLRINELLNRIQSLKLDGKPPAELILATNPTLEGDATAGYLGKILESNFPDIQTTRLARGIQSGGELEFTDMSTLIRSLRDRRPVHE
jgi:recombination protein RecR